MAMSPMTFDGMMAPGSRNLVRGWAIQKAEGDVFNEVSAKGLATVNARGYGGLAKRRKFEEARGYPKLTKAWTTRKATGYSPLAIGFEARKAKTAAQYARAAVDWDADKTTKTPGPPPLSRGKRESGTAEDGSESEAEESDTVSTRSEWYSTAKQSSIRFCLIATNR
jgi:hypothetical protein